MRNFLKKFSIPLQAFAALGICLVMFWMLFVVAMFNPSPPSALEIQFRSTQDLSFASMNSTAAALAMDMIGDLMPSPIVMPVTGNESVTSTPTPPVAVTLRVVSTFPATATPFSLFSWFFPPTGTREPDEAPPVPTSTNTPRPTQTPRPTSTATSTRTPTPTNTPTNTPMPTSTRTPTPTRTPTLADTETNTPVTPTPITPTATPIPTNTREPDPTDEPAPTPTPTQTDDITDPTPVPDPATPTDDLTEPTPTLEPDTTTPEGTP